MTQSGESEFDRLFYPYLFESERVSAESVLAQVRHSTLEKVREVAALRGATLEQNRDEIVAAGQQMADAFASGASLFAFGNGGSATDAQDIVADLVSPVRNGWQALPAITLTNDIAVITGVANDVGVDNIFARQLIALARPGDIALGFSTSGNSRNILSALEQAKRLELLTVGLAGYDGGNMGRSTSLDFCIVSPSDHVPRIQESQATVYHALLEIVQVCMQEVHA
jgi:D-sedoheptulose 7-phosphate isomerase